MDRPVIDLGSLSRPRLALLRVGLVVAGIMAVFNVTNGVCLMRPTASARS